jgi:hypothetical protein
MAVNKKRGDGPGLWEEFAGRHEGNPFLKLDPLYSLPEMLIDIIAALHDGPLRAARGESPDFLTKEEVAFERDLSRTVSGGFLFGKPFFWRLPGEEPFQDPLLEPLKAQKLLDAVKDLRAEFLQPSGLNPLQVRAAAATEKKYETFADMRTAAYAGWLVLNRRFRDERDALRQESGRHVEEIGFFPWFPEGARPDAAFEPFLEFYGRWGLEGFLTWDLPIPLQPALFCGRPYNPSLTGRGGINLFIPSYLLRDGRLDLRQLARHQLRTQDLSHLGGWLETASCRREQRGDTRLRNALILYRYQKLAIESRYGGRPGWDVARQDAAFARYLRLSRESVKRVRLHLQRHLSR